MLRVLIWMMCLVPWCVSGAVVLDADTGAMDVSSQAAFFRDAGGEFSFEQVCAPDVSGQFVVSSNGWPNFGFTSDAVWLRLELQSSSSDVEWFYAALRSTRIEEIDWYVQRSGDVEHTVAGFGVHRATSQKLLRYPILPIRMNAGERVTLYVRARSRASLHMPLSILGAQKFAWHAVRMDLLYVFLYGCLAILFVLALIFALVSRVPGFFSYALTVGSQWLLHWVLSGHWHWLDWPFCQWVSIKGVAFLMQASVLTTIMYMRDFFVLHRTMPRFDVYVRRFLLFGIVFLVLTQVFPFSFSIRLLYWEMLFVGLALMLTAIVLTVRGVKSARIYLLSWLQYFCFLLYNMGVHLAILPHFLHPIVLILMAFTLSYILYFVVMAARVREMYQEKEQTRLEKEQVRLDARARFLRYVEQVTRDLHDGVAGALSHIAMMAMNAKHKQDEQDVRADIHCIGQLAVDAGSELRNMMNAMESGNTCWADWYSQTEQRLRMVLESSCIAFDVVLEGDPATAPLPLCVAMSLQRMLKELVTNTIRHANATSLILRVCFEPEKLVLHLSDNGSGNLPDDAEASSGRGLRNVSQRVKELGGRMDITSETGTLITIDIPLSSIERIGETLC